MQCEVSGGTCAEGGGRLVRVVAAVVDAVAQQVGRHAKLLAGAAKLATRQFRCNPKPTNQPTNKQTNKQTNEPTF